MKEALEDVSQSMDDAEGGLDGLIQALDCDVSLPFAYIEFVLYYVS